MISRYHVIGQPPREKDEKYRIDCLLFSISDKDTNRDGVIDANDQIVVYACDIDGSNLRRIVPEGTMILNIKYEPDLRLMYLSTISDTNHDGKYTTHDKKSLLSYRIGDKGPGQPVVEDKVTSEIKSILNAE